MKLAWIAIVLGILSLGLPNASVAEPSELPTSQSIEPLTQQVSALPEPPSFGLDQLNQSLCPDRTVGTRDVIQFKPELTTPSLWWARDQFSAEAKFGGKLFVGWLACSQQQQSSQAVQADKSAGNAGIVNAVSNAGAVNVIVNAQLWSLLERVERYEFLHQFGTAVAQAGQDSNQPYQLWVFDRQGGLLGFYACPFVSPEVPNLARDRLETQYATEKSLGDKLSDKQEKKQPIAQAWTPTPAVVIPQYRFKRLPTSCLYLND